MKKESIASLESMGFLGVPVKDFEDAGKEQLQYLLKSGMNTDSKFIDIGCGVLRSGYHIINFLNPCRYFGIEPHKGRLKIGIEIICGDNILQNKNPRFDNNDNFDASVFNEKFDFFLAYSIWTHACKSQIEVMLDTFIKNSKKTSKFLTTYLPSNENNEDYQGNVWFGTSHESDRVGCINHSFEWINSQCEKRGLVVKGLGKDITHGQEWLEIQYVINK